MYLSCCIECVVLNITQSILTNDHSHIWIRLGLVLLKKEFGMHQQVSVVSAYYEGMLPSTLQITLRWHEGCYTKEFAAI